MHVDVHLMFRLPRGVLVHICSMAILTEWGMLPFKPTDCGQPKPATMCLVTPAAAVDIQFHTSPLQPTR